MKQALLFLSLVFLFHHPANAQAKIDYRVPGAVIPPFVLERPDGGTFSNNILKPGSPAIVMIFSPQCDHCEHTIDSLKTLAKRFRKTQLVLVAEDRNKEYMKAFVKKTGMAQYPLFSNVGVDKGNFVMSIYTFKLLPQLNIYDANHKLVKTFAGNFPIDSLKAFIK